MKQAKVIHKVIHIEPQLDSLSEFAIGDDLLSAVLGILLMLVIAYIGSFLLSLLFSFI